MIILNQDMDNRRSKSFTIQHFRDCQIVSDPHEFCNYRPFSLLPTISKVFEKVVHKQLYEYQKNLPNSSQYEFRPNHATEYAAMELVDKAMCDIEKDKIPLSIFLGLSKVFETLDHTILLKKTLPLWTQRGLFEIVFQLSQ